MKRKILGYYDYTVILTYCGMFFAFQGILWAIGQNYWEAVLCLILAGVCDMFDGTVAATKTRTDSEKRFGIQIDSLSDLISFGVLPGVIVYMVSEKNPWVGMIASVFVLCALIRLAFFNVMEEERQQQTEEKRKSYLGVPVTTIAILLPMVYLAYNYRFCKNRALFPVLLVFTGIGYLSPVEIKKPGLPGKIVLLVLGMLEVAGMLLYFRWGMIYGI